ncbi:energy-coupling factor transporter transmembrane component T [Sporomusa sp.]|uniref:energy-coupling factor transporter transmembrane component T n=1 Tax=Sporomusa sp. TaxID=2078658 RepID=UPI002B7C1429|nr:energy-coupling factor transporter transmembrane component T [Sporomusa sp.]HWR06645.1 energy-coupling factor transporter transmembrane component T [Sporomusa sp.]
MEALGLKAEKPDPRVWLFLVVTVSWLTYFCGSRGELFSLFLLLAVLMFVQKMWLTALYFAAFYLVLLVLQELLRLIAVPLVNMVAGMLILLFFRLLPVYMAYSIMLKKTAMNELMIALEQLRVPKLLIIPLAVVYRYLPTLRQEIVYIRDSLRMRGLNPSLAAMLLHPVTMVETFMIPLLIRSGKLADELAAAALCKGIDAGQPRTSCTGVRFALQDAVWCMVIGIVAAAFVFMHGPG